MPLFKSVTAQEVWVDHHCHRCFQPDEAMRRLHGKDTQCPIQKRALESQRKPVKWDRNTRARDMQSAYKCREFMRQPASTQRVKVNEFDTDQDSLFEVAPVDYSFVPVDGWPDRPRKGGEGDHA
jgi:hypothetical protein